MNKMINEPKIGEIVSVNFSDMYRIEINTFFKEFNENEFQYKFYIEPIYKLDEYKKNLSEVSTLLIYIGNGKFIELYSKKEINYFYIDDDKLQTDFQKQYSPIKNYNENPNYIQFMNIYQTFVKRPIFIKNWDNVDLEKQKEIGKQVSKKDLINSSFKEIYEQSSYSLINGLRKTIEKDIDYAYGKNEIINFEKQFSLKK